MTNKEKELMEKSGYRNKYNYIFKKEMVKYFTKKGYEVEEGNFAFRDCGSKSPVVCIFGINSDFSYPDEKIIVYNGYKTEAFKQWKENDLSLVKTFRECNERCPKNIRFSVSKEITFKEFLKSIKKYCKENGMYKEPKADIEIETL